VLQIRHSVTAELSLAHDVREGANRAELPIGRRVQAAPTG